MTRFVRLLRDGITAFALLAFIGLIALKLNGGPETIHSGGFFTIDGDTLSRNGERFRLKGIDAPEYEQSCERNGTSWSCGRAARALLEKLMAAGAAECRGGERDRYHRLLVSCMAGGANVNGEMVRQGMAVSYGAYRKEEAEARQARAGLWAGRFEMPQDVRHHDMDTDGSDAFAGITEFVKRLAGWN